MSQPLHVLVIPSWYPQSEQDVDGIFFQNQAQALQRKGLKVGVLAPMFRYLRKQPASILNGPYGFRKYRQSGLDVYSWHSMYFFPHFPFIDIDRRRWVAAGVKAFKRYIQERGIPDIIHAHSMNYAGILAYTLSRKYGIPYVITEHSSTITRNLIRPHQWHIMQEAAKHCAARLAVSRHFAEVLQQKYGNQWHYLPNILGNIFTQDFEFRSKNPPHFTLCTVSHLRRLKGHDVLLRALALAHRQRPDIKLKIGGDGPEAHNLQQLADELGLTHAVSFLGALQPEEVRTLMRQSQAFVLASRTETFGVVYIEALSQGIPVIATRCGGAESIVSSRNGCLVDVDDIEALSAAIVHMRDHAQEFPGTRLRLECLDEFGEDAVIGKLIEIFQSILSKQR